VLILNLYGKNSDAQMQGLHAMFGLGAFISPLLVGPFLTTPTPQTPHLNTTNTTLNNGTLDAKNFTSNSTQHPTSIDHTSLQYPYIISMLFFVIPVITFIGAGFRDHGRNQQRDKPRETASGSDQRAYRGFTLVLLFLFLLLYVGLEVAIGGLIFSFSFKHGILKSKSLAAYLTSTFWGSFCVGRFLSIPLSMCVRAYRILVMDLLGCLIGAAILTFVATSVQAWLWIGTSILGFCMAAVFPSTMSWAETFMHISGKTASILVVGASLGEMTIPLVIGTLMERNGASVFVHAIFVIIVLTTIVFIIASVLAKRQRKGQTDGFHFHYHKGTEQSNHSMFSKPKGDEVIQLLEDSTEIFSVDN
jgi:FHS family Na+ dependent glucose MFS transporter 1